MHLALVVIFMTLPFAVSLSAADGIRVPLRLIARNSPAPPGTATLELRSVSEPGAEAKSITLTNGSGEAVLPAGSVWQASVAAEGWWGSTATVTAGEQASTIDLWKTTEVHGRVSVERGAEMPEALNAVVEVPPYGPRAAEVPRGSTFRCTIEDGLFRCAIPIATLDLALRAKGFTPHYRWNVDVANTRELAPVALRRGASFVAWLDRASAEALKKPARAKFAHVGVRGAVRDDGAALRSGRGSGVHEAGLRAARATPCGRLHARGDGARLRESGRVADRDLRSP